jgi:hypothetical protein
MLIVPMFYFIVSIYNSGVSVHAGLIALLATLTGAVVYLAYRFYQQHQQKT